MDQNRGSYRRIGQTGEWVDTLMGVCVGKTIVTLNKLGDLWATDPETGKSRRVNEDKYTHSTFMFGAKTEVYTIDKDGTLWATAVDTGKYRKLGDNGGYKGTRLGAMAGDLLVTIENSGRLYATRPTGEYVRPSQDNYSKTQFLFGGETLFFTIENNTMYAVNPADGTYKRLGGQGDFANTSKGTGMNDKAYSLETTGFIWETDPATGKYAKLCAETYLNTLLMFSGNGRLYTTEPTGCLYEIFV